ncbi:NADAR family protein [Streptomyces sp. SID8111]|uniref:NADAR family protein n=1 Tax=Streptomyces sp. SID8111 TaxID=2706100 RepID=UPI0013C081DE|nr:NADAR family protein [Streptomyces sp. SID8111]NEC28937.1 NADAR family protein [Streptomyces sp. SID8111]
MHGTTGSIGSRRELIEALRAGASVKYLHFWRHRPLPDGRLGASCLSQWWPSPFTVDGVRYATAEHWMMAGKARLFSDREAERRILAGDHPAQAQKEGRRVRGFDEAVWARERFGLVVEGNAHKFASDPGLRSFLLGTGAAGGGGRVLVEASPLDRIWGIGLAADDERAGDPERWRGENLLGFALMAARDRLRAG